MSRKRLGQPKRQGVTENNSGSHRGKRQGVTEKELGQPRRQGVTEKLQAATEAWCHGGRVSTDLELKEFQVPKCQNL